MKTLWRVKFESRFADSVPVFGPIFGFVWKHLVKFDLGGHNLGTLSYLCNPLSFFVIG